MPNQNRCELPLVDITVESAVPYTTASESVGPEEYTQIKFSENRDLSFSDFHDLIKQIVLIVEGVCPTVAITDVDVVYLQENKKIIRHGIRVFISNVDVTLVNVGELKEILKAFFIFLHSGTCHDDLCSEKCHLDMARPYADAFLSTYSGRRISQAFLLAIHGFQPMHFSGVYPLRVQPPVQPEKSETISGRIFDLNTDDRIVKVKDKKQRQYAIQYDIGVSFKSLHNRFFPELYSHFEISRLPGKVRKYYLIDVDDTKEGASLLELKLIP